MKGFSIVICCYNSSKRLEKTFAFLKRLRTEDFGYEVIIVDNNSSDNTYDIALSIANNCNNTVTKVFRELKSGKSYALITGISKAVYEYLVVCDDDNWLNEDYLIVAQDVMRRNPSIGVLGGRGVIHSELILSPWFPLLQNAWAVGKQAEKSGELTNRPNAVWGAGMVIRKIAWNMLFTKGFTGFLTGRKRELLNMAGEDTEICILIKALGYRIFYEDKMWYQHDVQSARLSWNSLKELWEGFSRSSVYFDMYNFYFSSNSLLKSAEVKKNFQKELKQTFGSFFSSSSVINFCKIIYIGFVEDRPGYLPGLEKRKQLSRLRELWRIRKTYAKNLEVISKFQR